MNRRQTLVLGSAGVAAAGAGAGWAIWRREPDDPAVTELWRLTFDRPEGGELALTSLRGQVLVINFWATWCPPCIKELPEFDRLHRAQASRGVQVLGLAVDGPTPVRQFLAQRPVSFAIGLAGFEGTDLSRRLGNSAGGLPFTVVIDRGGRLRHRKLGPTDFDELSRWVGPL